MVLAKYILTFHFSPYLLLKPLQKLHSLTYCVPCLRPWYLYSQDGGRDMELLGLVRVSHAALHRVITVCLIPSRSLWSLIVALSVMPSWVSIPREAYQI